MKIEETANGKFKITHNLVTVWVTREEAEAAARDPRAAASIMKRLERTR